MTPTFPSPAVPEPPLPAWMVDSHCSCESSRDRDGFLRRNLLRLTSLLAEVRAGGSPSSPLDRALARVPAALRLVGLVVAVGCVSASTNMLLVWIVLAAVLAALALRPAEDIASVAGVSLAAALVALVVTLPAALLGMAPASSATRMAAKVFVTVSLVLGLTQNVAWERLTGALVEMRVPGTVAFVIDSAVRDIALLGREASLLTEALGLRSVGRDASKTASAAGVMGMTFLKATDLAARQTEAMRCRGFAGAFRGPSERLLCAAGVAYLVGLAAFVALFLWLEWAMGVAA